jgi:hypothetical protein
MRMSGGKRAGVVGVGAASLAMVSCINFAPAVSSQASTVEAARSGSVGFADVTGDGADDVVVAVSLPEAGDAVVRMAPCGGGCLERREQVVPGGEVLDLATADFDGDGVADVAVETDAGVRVYFGGAAEGGRPEGLVEDDFVVAVQSSIEPRGGIVAGDFDGDGDADLGVMALLAYDFVAGDGDGGFADPVNVIQLPASPLGSVMHSLGTGDVDGDGVAEVLAVFRKLDGTSVSVHIVAFRDGVSSIASYAEMNVLGLGTVTASDIDGDGLDDVAVERFTSPRVAGVVVLLRSTGAGFTGFGPGGAVTSLPLSNLLGGSSDLALRDIDGDGIVDFLGSNNAQLSWWHGVGNGNFAVRVDRAAGPGPASLAWGNVDASGRADLVVANRIAPFAHVSYLTNASQLPDP